MYKVVRVNKGEDSSEGNVRLSMGNGHLREGKVELHKRKVRHRGKNLEQTVKEFAKCVLLLVDDYNPKRTNFFFVEDKTKSPTFYFFERSSKSSKHFIGYFELPGGEIEKNEKKDAKRYGAALLRELYEETNLDFHLDTTRRYEAGKVKPEFYSSELTIDNKEYIARHSFYNGRWSSLISLSDVISIPKGRFFPYLLIANKSFGKEIKLSEEHSSHITLTTDYVYTFMYLNNFFLKSEDLLRDEGINVDYGKYGKIVKDPKKYDNLSEKEKSDLSDEMFSVPSNTFQKEPIYFLPTTINILGQSLEYVEKINGRELKILRIRT